MISTLYDPWDTAEMTAATCTFFLDKITAYAGNLLDELDRLGVVDDEIIVEMDTWMVTHWYAKKHPTPDKEA